MALKLIIGNDTIPTLIGSVLNLSGTSELYIRVDAFSGEQKNCRFLLGFYKMPNEVLEDQEMVLDKILMPQVPYSFEMVEDGSENDCNLRQQAYNYLKQLPEFQDCTDC